MLGVKTARCSRLMARRDELVKPAVVLFCSLLKSALNQTVFGISASEISVNDALVFVGR